MQKTILLKFVAALPRYDLLKIRARRRTSIALCRMRVPVDDSRRYMKRCWVLISGVALGSHEEPDSTQFLICESNQFFGQVLAGDIAQSVSSDSQVAASNRRGSER